MGMDLLQNYFWIHSRKCFLFFLWNTQIEIIISKKPSLRVSHELSIYLKFLHQDQNRLIRSLSKRYPQFSLPTIWRHSTKEIDVHLKQTKGKGWRKSKLSLRDERSIIRWFNYARKQDGNFTSKSIKLYSSVSSVHDRGVGRVSSKYGHHYQQARCKELLTESDLKLHLKFAKDKKYYNAALWSSGICFYLGAKHFIHKANPIEQAKAPKSLVWRKKNEGLIKGCTSNRNKAGHGGKVASFEIFKSSCNLTGIVFVHDSDPSQNSKTAKTALGKIGAVQFSIPFSVRILILSQCFGVCTKDMKK